MVVSLIVHVDEALVNEGDMVLTYTECLSVHQSFNCGQLALNQDVSVLNTDVNGVQVALQHLIF